MVQLETCRLRLRPLDESDFEDFYEYLTDPELCRMYYGMAGNVDRSTGKMIFLSFCRNGKTYALEHKQDHKMVGHLVATTLELPEETVRSFGEKKGVTVAFAVSPLYQRQGLVQEALAEVFGFLFQTYDYIHCAYFDFNCASASLQKKFGFKKVASDVVKTQSGDITIIHNVLFNRRQKRAFLLSKPQVEELFEYLEAKVDEYGCDYSRTHTRAWLKAHAPEKVDEILAEIAEMGGYCDCEVLMNCYEDYFD